MQVAIPAGIGDATAAIQQAVDETSVAGGGIVTLLAGTHLCGPLQLKSRVELNLQRGAILAFTPDYERLAGNEVSVVAEGSNRALIVARGAVGIALTGPGEIRAPGRAYIQGDDPEVGTLIPASLRPRVVVLEDCADIRIEEIHIADSPMWTLHLVGCSNVHVSGVVIANDVRLPNTDGIVIDSCSDVLVANCDIETADDGVCLKTTNRASGIGRMANVTVRNCRVSSQSCALKIGTESFGDIEDVVFEDCVVFNSNRGLGIFSRDGGHIRRVRFSRIDVECHETPDGFWGSGEGLTITALARRPGEPVGVVSEIVVEGVGGTVEGAVNLVSPEPGNIRDVVLRAIRLRQRPGRLGTARRFDLRPTVADLAAAGGKGRPNAWTKDETGRILGLVDYPDGMPGLYASGVDNLELCDVEIDRPTSLPTGWAAVPTQTK
ncbi:MAG: glycoside hydrolase family 28 protein [Devosia sp.]